MLIIKISFDAKTCYGLLIILTLVNIIMKVNVTFLYGKTLDALTCRSMNAIHVCTFSSYIR